MSNVETVVTSEVLNRATHTVWLDTDLATGSGIVEASAPDVFAMWDDGLEYVRFGKILGLAGTDRAVMPLLPQLVGQATEAARSDPGECVFVGRIPETENVEELWQTFFKNQIRMIGKIAVRTLQDLLMADPIFPYSPDNLQYVASVIDPAAGVEKIQPTAYDNFDSFEYLGLSISHSSRRTLARSLSTIAGIQPVDLNLIHSVINRTAEFFNERPLQ